MIKDSKSRLRGSMLALEHRTEVKVFFCNKLLHVVVYRKPFQGPRGALTPREKGGAVVGR